MYLHAISATRKKETDAGESKTLQVKAIIIIFSIIIDPSW